MVNFLRTRLFTLVIPIVLVLISSAGVVCLTWRTNDLSNALARAAGQSQTIEQAHLDLKKHWEQLHQQYDQLVVAQHSLTQDRDNLLLQVKANQELIEQHKLLVAERDQLETLLGQSAQELQQVHQQIPQLQDKLQTLEQAQQASTQEQIRLTQALEQAQKHSQEKQLRQTQQQLKQELTAQQKAEQEMKRVALSTQQELGELQKREDALQTRMRKLQQDYTTAIAENSQLRRERRAIPKDVTRLAQQHERLIKETADMHYNMGVMFNDNKQYQRALVEFSKVLELRPDDADAVHNLGVIYADYLPNREKSIAYFRRYLELNPDASDANWVKQYIASWQAWEAKDRLE